MKAWIKEACEQIDAGFFSGDTFHSKEALDEIGFYIGRWTRQMAIIQEFLKEEKSSEEE